MSDILGTDITVEEIKQKIAQLSITEEGESLKGAMSELKLALRYNPEAANLLLPEEIGQLITCLRKITATELVPLTEKDKTAAVNKAIKKVNLNDPEFLQQALKDF